MKESPKNYFHNYRQKTLIMPQRLHAAMTFWKHWKDGQIESDFGTIYGVWHGIFFRNPKSSGGKPDKELLAYSLLPSPKPSHQRRNYVSVFPLTVYSP